MDHFLSFSSAMGTCVSDVLRWVGERERETAEIWKVGLSREDFGSLMRIELAR